MLFNTFEFLIFFPVVTLLFFVVPRRLRYIWLLLASYFFYMCWNAKYGLLLLGTTFVTWLCGLVLGRIARSTAPENLRARRRKWCLAVAVVVNFGVLFVFKYFDFALVNLNRVLTRLHLQAVQSPFDLVLPVGISFFTFQAVGYVIDVYRGDVEPEKNFLRYALFLSFFPQLVAGPIERSKNLLPQIQHLERVEFVPEDVRYGLLAMALGLAQKMVIADRIGSIIDPVFADFNAYSGAQIIVAVLLFTVQLYCDFAGYSQIAIGAARVLGIRLMENFRAPYLSGSVKEFWRNWHISLTTWFTDYVYIPLGGNRKGKARKYLNTMIVFLISGLWHGANWSYVAWGGLNGLYQILQDATNNLRPKLYRVLHIHTGSAGFKVVSRVVVTGLYSFSLVFFRASYFQEAIAILQRIAATFQPMTLLSTGVFDLFGSAQMLAVMIAAIGILFVLDYVTYTKGDCRAAILRQDVWVRWSIYLALIVAILVFGVYGESYVQTQFIYFQF